MSATTTRVRSLIIDKLFGGGIGGFVATAAVGWAVDQIRNANGSVTLEVADIRPGEQYIVTTRPAMKRPERKVAKKRAKVERKLRSETAPSRKTRRIAKRLARNQRRAEVRTEGSRRQRRAVRRSDRLGRRYDRLATPSRKANALQTKLDAYDVTLERHRSKALAKTDKRHRSPRNRTYR